MRLFLTYDSNLLQIKALRCVFNFLKPFQVSSWITHVIVSQPTHEERKAVLSCIVRAALACWNLGNFNSAMEIITGLKWVLRTG